MCLGSQIVSPTLASTPSFRSTETISSYGLPSSSLNSTCQNNLQHPPQFLSPTYSSICVSCPYSDTTMLFVTQARNRGSQETPPRSLQFVLAKPYLPHFLNIPNEGPLNLPLCHWPVQASVTSAIAMTTHPVDPQPIWASQWPIRKGQGSDLACHWWQTPPWVSTTKGSPIPLPHTQA